MWRNCTYIFYYYSQTSHIVAPTYSLPASCDDDHDDDTRVTLVCSGKKLEEENRKVLLFIHLFIVFSFLGWLLVVRECQMLTAGFLGLWQLVGSSICAKRIKILLQLKQQTQRQSENKKKRKPVRDKKYIKGWSRRYIFSITHTQITCSNTSFIISSFV